MSRANLSAAVSLLFRRHDVMPPSGKPWDRDYEMVLHAARLACCEECEGTKKNCASCAEDRRFIEDQT